MNIQPIWSKQIIENLLAGVNECNEVVIGCGANKNNDRICLCNDWNWTIAPDWSNDTCEEWICLEVCIVNNIYNYYFFNQTAQ